MTFFFKITYINRGKIFLFYLNVREYKITFCKITMMIITIRMKASRKVLKIRSKQIEKVMKKIARGRYSW